MRYTSFEKFNEISNNYFDYFENNLNNIGTENIGYSMHTNVVLGNQKFVADVINSTTRNKLTPKDIFEIDLVLNSLLDIDSIYDLSYNIIKSPDLTNHPLVMDFKLKETSYIKMKPSNRVFVNKSNKLKKIDSVNYIVEDINDDMKLSYMNKLGNDEKEEVANFLSKKYNKSIIKAPKWDVLFENNSQTKLSLACISINLKELKELYIKQLPNIKKIYKNKIFQGDLFINTNSSREYVKINKESKIPYKDKEIDLGDWSLVEELNEVVLSPNILKDLGSFGISKSLLRQLDINSIDKLIYLVEDNKVDLLIEKFFEYNNLDFNLEYKIETLMSLYNIEEYVFNRIDKRQGNVDKEEGFLLYQLINKDYDFKERTLKLLDKLFNKFPNFILEIKEENRKEILNFINNIVDVKYLVYKTNFQKYLKDLNKENVEVKVHHVEEDISMLIFNKSAIFNFAINPYKVKLNMEFFNKENINNIVDDISISIKVNRVVVNIYFNEILDNKLKEMYINKFIEIIKNSDKIEDNKSAIENDFTSLKRQFLLEQSLKEKDNVVIRKKI